MPRFTWNEMAIEAALEPIVAELGRLPTRAELRERGLSNLWDAMRRRGGVQAWARRMAPAPADAIRERAYFISLNSPQHDAMAHWLQAERELTAA